MRVLSRVIVLLVCLGGCSPSPTITKGTFTDSYTLTMQRGSMDVVVRTSGAAQYTVTNYAMNHPMGQRPDTEATFTTPAGTFVISDRNVTEAGLKINGTFYPQPPSVSTRSTILIDSQGVITVQPAKEPAVAPPPIAKP
ncbi:hypothetical protein J8F10_30810 [Gemmata sp. G18]|uniref:Lipoprotein n=1 Tax=Gemmata palustris TaxID=2822762 RepID=A0ABS5C125_9BACT|nr:hypothetical protein [Gemmata palustris]MBP3959659.1 hypothetical protein [Gemmata palustris]